MKKKWIVTGIVVLAVMLSSCKKAPLPQQSDPVPAPSAVLPAETVYDLLYAGSSEQQSYDLALPEREKNAPVKVDAFLLIHGGGWQSGDKAEYHSWMQTMQEAGLVAASMNYRTIDEAADWEIMLLDITLALESLKLECAERGISVRKVALMGYSSGGHLAMLYSFKCAEISPIPIAFCVGQAALPVLTDPGLYPENQFGDILLENIGRLISNPFTRAELGAREAELLAASPFTYITQTTVPVIFAHGTRDLMVPISGAETLDAALSAAGVPHRYIIFQDDDHGLGVNQEAIREFASAIWEYTELYMG